MQRNSFYLIHHKTEFMGQPTWNGEVSHEKHLKGETGICLLGTNANEWHINQSVDSTRNYWWITKAQRRTKVKLQSHQKRQIKQSSHILYAKMELVKYQFHCSVICMGHFTGHSLMSLFIGFSASCIKFPKEDFSPIKCCNFLSWIPKLLGALWIKIPKDPMIQCANLTALLFAH